eukprot:s99_g7.t1
MLSSCSSSCGFNDCLMAGFRRALFSGGMLLWSCCRRRASAAMSADPGFAKGHHGQHGHLNGKVVSKGENFDATFCSAGTCEGENGWVAYLLVSPTRSSIVGYALRNDVDNILRWHNGDTVAEQQGPPAETELLRPWRLAELSSTLPSESHAATKAWQVSRQSGFRARLTAMRREMEEASDVVEPLPLEAALDALTYVQVEFSSPNGGATSVRVLALVDTGSNDCDLKGSLIDELRLPVARGGTSVETAANKVVEIPIYQAKVRVQGRECIVKVSPADEDYEAIGGGVSTSAADDVDKEFDFGTTTDEAVLGADALASLGLVVDCKRRRLLDSQRLPELPSVTACPRAGRSNCMHVKMSFGKPMIESEKDVVVKALVDTGSTDVDLQESKIKALGLVVDDSEIPALFETAGGVTTTAPIYWAIAKLGSREARVRLSPSLVEEEEEDSEDSSEDTLEDEDALLGHDALAALNLLVDCKHRRLLVASDQVMPPSLHMEQNQASLKRRRRGPSAEE